MNPIFLLFFLSGSLYASEIVRSSASCMLLLKDKPRGDIVPYCSLFENNRPTEMGQWVLVITNDTNKTPNINVHLTPEDTEYIHQAESPFYLAGEAEAYCIMNVTAGNTIKEFEYAGNSSGPISNKGSWSGYIVPSFFIVVTAFCIWLYQR